MLDRWLPTSQQTNNNKKVHGSDRSDNFSCISQEIEERLQCSKSVTLLIPNALMKINFHQSLEYAWWNSYFATNLSDIFCAGTILTWWYPLARSSVLSHLAIFQKINQLVIHAELCKHSTIVISWKMRVIGLISLQQYTHLFLPCLLVSCLNDGTGL